MVGRPIRFLLSSLYAPLRTQWARLSSLFNHPRRISSALRPMMICIDSSLRSASPFNGSEVRQGNGRLAIISPLLPARLPFGN